MEKTWKPVVAGIQDIVSGAVGLIAALGLIIAIMVTSGAALVSTCVRNFLYFLVYAHINYMKK